MSILLALLNSLIKALIGETFAQLRMEDTVEDSEPALDSLVVVDDPDDLGYLDIFDGLLDENHDGLRAVDALA